MFKQRIASAIDNKPVRWLVRFLAFAVVAFDIFFENVTWFMIAWLVGLFPILGGGALLIALYVQVGLEAPEAKMYAALIVAVTAMVQAICLWIKEVATGSDAVGDMLLDEKAKAAADEAIELMFGPEESS